MIAKDIKVSIGKGDSKKMIPAVFVAMETKDVSWNNDIKAYVINVGVAETSSEEIVKYYNYAADLKARAAIRAANTDVGQKTKNRQQAIILIMTHLGNGDDSYQKQYMELVAKDDKKAVNAYLDDLYEEEIVNKDEVADENTDGNESEE